MAIGEHQLLLVDFGVKLNIKPGLSHFFFNAVESGDINQDFSGTLKLQPSIQPFWRLGHDDNVVKGNEEHEEKQDHLQQ